MSYQIYLQFLNGPRADQKVHLDHLPVVVGRTNESDISLEWDGLISGRHFEIIQENAAVFLRDVGSRNGSRINGSSVVTQRLYDGDVIEVGSSRLQVFISTREPETPPQQAPAASQRPLNPFESSIIFKGSIPESSRAAPPANNLVNSPKPSVASPVVNRPVEVGPGSAGPVIQSEEVSEPATDVIEQVRLLFRDPVGSASENSVDKILWLAPGQVMTAGRSPRCDCVIDGDSFMSSVHFRLTCQTDRCILEDMESTSGTWLNDVRVQRDDLLDGDRLRAGGTEFRVEVEGVKGPIRRSKAIRAERPSQKPVELPAGGGQPLDLIRSNRPSGVNVLEGLHIEQLPPAALMEILKPFGQIFLLIDMSRCSIPLPADFDPKDGQLFHWLPASLAIQSPLFFSSDELPEWPKYVEDVFGNDALVVFQSEQSKADLLRLLQECLGGDPMGGKSFRGILGLCWPSVMIASLENQGTDLAKKLFSKFSLILTETSDGKSCQAFALDPARIESILGQFDRRRILYSINRREDGRIGADQT